MKRLAAIAVLGLALTACGSSGQAIHGNGPGPLKPVSPSPIAFRFSAAKNRAFAERDARKLLGIVVVPRGAHRVAAVPRSAPKWFREELSHNMSGAATVHRTWVIHQPLKRVVRFIRTHWRPVARPELPFNRWTNRIGSRPGDSYQFRAVPGRSSNRWLNVTELALPTGATVVTAQSGDQWIKPPPRNVELPRTIKTIDITGGYDVRRPVVRLHVRDRYDVGSIVSWVNGLGVSPNYICFGLYSRPAVTLTFRDAAGKTVARVMEGGSAGGPCGSLSLTVKGRKAPPLITGDLLLRIDRLLDANLTPPPLRNVANCLRARGWHVRTTGRRKLVARQDGPPTTLVFHATGKVTRTGPLHMAVNRCLRISPGFGGFGG
jgi:hypothetical protein